MDNYGLKSEFNRAATWGKIESTTGMNPEASIETPFCSKLQGIIKLCFAGLFN
jgi:hypothetical protein